MKHALLTLALLLVAVPTWAQSGLGTRANDTLKRMFTQAGHFGFPPYTADPFTCTEQTKRATYYNTTSNTALFCNGTVWSSLGGTTLPVDDGTAVVKGSADTTKLLRFEVDGFTTGTTRVMTPPNANATLAGINVTQTWTVDQNYGAGVFSIYSSNGGVVFPSSGGIITCTVSTPDTVCYLPSTLSNTYLHIETADQGFDYAVPAQTNPTIVVASANQSLEQRLGIRHNQTQGQVVDLATTAASARPIGFMGGSAVASATTITPTGNVFHVTGTTSITGMTAMASGTCVTLIFDAALTFTDGAGTLRLAGNFVTTADDAIYLCCDGTNWFESGRSIN